MAPFYLVPTLDSGEGKLVKRGALIIMSSVNKPLYSRNYYHHAKADHSVVHVACSNFAVGGERQANRYY